MILKASLVVFSHLSDAQETMSYNETNSSQHINFAKFIISKTNGDLTQMIDADAMWTEFEEFMKKRNTRTVLHNGEQIETTDLSTSEVNQFITNDMKQEMSRLIKEKPKNNSGKIEAILYLKKQAAEQGKHIFLRDAKDVADKLELYLKYN